MKLILALATKELRSRWISLIALSFYGLIFALMYIAIFPAIKQHADQLNQVLGSMTGALKTMGIQNLGFTHLESFLSIEYLTIVWPILAIILAASWSGGFLAGEIERGTMGLLLGLPFGRARIFWTKYVVGVIGLVIFTALSIGASKPLAMMFNLSFSTNHYLKTIALCLLFAWALFSIGMLVSAIASERGKVTIVVAGLAILMYVATVLSGLKDSLSWLHHLSFFSYLDAQNVLVNGDWSWLHVTLFAAVIIVATLLAAQLFSRRDITV